MQGCPRCGPAALCDLSACKHALTIESNEQNETARLEAAKGVVLIFKSEPHSRRKGRRMGPIGRLSRSVSRARGPSLAPSIPSTLDKAPTKADFVVGK